MNNERTDGRVEIHFKPGESVDCWIMGGSISDYYVYALRDAFEGYYLYVDVDEITILREIQENITNRATRPDKIRKQITDTLSRYQRLPVKK